MAKSVLDFASAVGAGVVTLLTCDVVVALTLQVIEQVVVVPILYQDYPPGRLFYDSAIERHIHSQLPEHVQRMPGEQQCHSFLERIGNGTAMPPPLAPPNAAFMCQMYYAVR